MKYAAAALLLGSLTLAGHAQPVYRCGSTYTQTPCPEGKIVAATDPRTAAQRAEASRVAADERRLAADMRRQRLAEQAALRPAAATSLSGPAPAASAAERHHVKKKRLAPKAARTTDFVAIDPASRERGRR